MKMTYDKAMELAEQGYKWHHTAWASGYVSRVENDGMGWAETYKGRFGTGYKWHYSSHLSTRYHQIAYLIKEA